MLIAHILKIFMLCSNYIIYIFSHFDYSVSELEYGIKISRLDDKCSL